MRKLVSLSIERYTQPPEWNCPRKKFIYCKLGINASDAHLQIYKAFGEGFGASTVQPGLAAERLPLNSFDRALLGGKNFPNVPKIEQNLQTFSKSKYPPILPPWNLYAAGYLAELFDVKRIYFNC
ncbi:hypothetical protein KIN20_023488 [Parelaphostrongylus tenuis]|uniref:Uncharacterized protein n=1 Tax=Parelaphostrongylus tenuis TaxID=148309 RepID=A0AAD5MRU2_PARTN|nr:hypothetical protein KIN20_023488 [Parelaphostrongylus tenuis]